MHNLSAGDLADALGRVKAEAAEIKAREDLLKAELTARGVSEAEGEKIFAKIEAFVPRSIADVLAKCRAGASNYGEGIAKKGEDLYASDRILLQMIADLERLEAVKVTA